MINLFAVALERCGHVVGHLTKEKSGRFSKTICFSLSANHGHYFRVYVTANRVNFGEGQGLQIPCTLRFTGEEMYIDVLKNILPSL